MWEVDWAETFGKADECVLRRGHFVLLVASAIRYRLNDMRAQHDYLMSDPSRLAA